MMMIWLDLVSLSLSPSPSPSQINSRVSGEKEMMLGLQIATARAIHTSVSGGPRLTKFTLRAPKRVQVEYGNGDKFSLSAEFLRIHSPAVDGKVRSIGAEKVISGRRHVGIISAQPVGNYGGTNKFSLSRDYIRTLKRHGLSRDPSRTRSAS
ncbi:hypothetical protein LINGRAHAP2_LOCUS34625 [Linum grandiflorum]